MNSKRYGTKVRGMTSSLQVGRTYYDSLNLVAIGCLMSLLTACQSSRQDQAGNLRANGSNHIRVQIESFPDPRTFGVDGALDFAADGKLVGVTWIGRPTPTADAVHYAIFEENGTLRCSSETDQDTDSIVKFPRLAMRLFYRNLISDPEWTNRFLPERDWAVDSKVTSCVRVVPSGKYAVDVEHWKLTVPLEKQWSWTRKEDFGPPLCTPEFVSLHGKQVVAVNCGDEMVFLDEESGKQFDSIPFEREGEVYIAGKTCVIPERGWLVCARHDSKRLRVFSLDAPHRILREVGAKGGGLGSWSPYRIESAMGGRLLLKDCDYGIRAPWPGGTREAVIYDTDTWKSVWYERDNSIVETAISPDGKRLAIRRGRVLEIRPLTVR